MASHGWQWPAMASRGQPWPAMAGTVFQDWAQDLEFEPVFVQAACSCNAEQLRTESAAQFHSNHSSCSDRLTAILLQFQTHMPLTSRHVRRSWLFVLEDHFAHGHPCETTWQSIENPTPSVLGNLSTSVKIKF